MHDENTNIKIKFSHKTMLYVYKTVQHNAITKKKMKLVSKQALKARHKIRIQPRTNKGGKYPIEPLKVDNGKNHNIVHKFRWVV